MEQGVLISLAALLITILSIVVRQATKSGKRDQEIVTLKEETNKNREKIRELYTQVSDHGTSIKVIINDIGTVKATTERIENKLDRLNEPRGAQ